MGSAEDDVVFVENASAGINAFLRSFGRTLRHGAKVLYLSCIYGMVRQVLELLVERNGVELVEVPLSAADLGSGARVVDSIKRIAAEHGGPAGFALAVVSHISSVPAIVLPVADITAAMAGTPVFIDGAHAPGQIPLDLGAIRVRHLNPLGSPLSQNGSAPGPGSAGRAQAYGAVGYVGNLHKWCYSPKGAGFLWVSPELQAAIIPPTLSGSAHQFIQSFAYTGTRDYTPFCSTGAGLDFRASLGTEADVHQYGHKLALNAGAHLAQVQP